MIRDNRDSEKRISKMMKIMTMPTSHVPTTALRSLSKRQSAQNLKILSSLTISGYHNNPSAFKSGNNIIIIDNIKISDISKCSFCKTTMHNSSKIPMDKNQSNRKWIMNLLLILVMMVAMILLLDNLMVATGVM